MKSPDTIGPRVLLGAVVVLHLLLIGAMAQVAVAATQALPVTVTGSTNWSVAASLPPVGPSTTFTYRVPPLTPIIGDWDGDGDRTPGTYENGHFLLSNALPPGAPTIDVTFGDRRGFPVVGDFNDDGFDDVAVYRSGLWQMRTETGGIGSGGTVGTPVPFTYGTGTWPTTIPVAGDWDNDGRDGIGAYTYASGLWQLRQTPEALGLDLPSFTYWAGAGSGSYPVVGDWNADGTDTVGVKTSNPAGSWLLSNANPGPLGEITFTFGLEKDLPLVGGKSSSPPTDVALSSSSVAENQPINTVVGTLSASDPDAGDTFTFSLVPGVGDTDNAFFNIAGSSLRTSAAFDFEAKSSYAIRVRVTDSGGLTREEQFTVAVTGVNDKPTDIALSNASVLENRPTGTAVGTLSSTDQDVAATHSYALVSGVGDTGNAQFQILGNVLQTNGSLNFEDGATRSVRVRTTDNGGLTYDEVLTITIIDANDAPIADDETFGGVQRAIGNTSHVVDDPSDGAPDPAGPQKSITGDILAGDADEDGNGSLAVVAGTFTTTDGGSVELQSDGDFTFFPRADVSCSDHSDSFNYTVTDQNNTKPPGSPATDVGTVTIEIQDCVWYVDNGAAGNGTSSSPYNSLADLDGAGGAGDVDAAGDRIFLYDGTYAGGLPLENQQPLSGQRHGLVVPDGGAGTVTLQAPGGGNSQINDGLVLAADNMVQGIHLGSAAGFALSGASVGNATMNSVTSGAINNPVGGGVSINGGTLNMQFTASGGVTSGGGANGIALTNTSGTFNASSGTLSNAANADVNLSGGTTSFTYGGSISDDVGQLVSISGQTGGTKDFNANVTDLGNGTGNGISLANNGGATIRFDGGLTLGTGANTAFSATGGGSVAVTDPAAANNTIATTSGRALTIADTTIHSDDVTFESVSTNGAASAIVLNNTGSSGNLAVTGAGGACAATGDACTGGTIQSTTGDAISLTSTEGVALTRTKVVNNLGNGIRGNNVNGFSLTDSVLNNNADDAATDEANLHFTNLAGNAAITRTLVAAGIEDNARIINSSATLTQLNVTDSTFRDTDTVSPGNNGLLLQADGGSITADVLGSKFLRNRANGLQAITNGTGSMNVEADDSGVTQSTFDDNNIGVNIAHNSSGSFSYGVRDLTIDGLNVAPGTGGSAAPINLNLAGAATTTMNGRVTGNTLTNSNSTTGPGIRMIGNGVATMTALVDANSVSQVANRGIEVLARDGSNRINATITNNTVALNDALAGDGIRIDAGAVGTDTTTICADLRANTATTTAAGLFGIRVRQRFAGTNFILEGYAGAPTDLTAVVNFLSANNNAAAASADRAGAGFTSTANCPTPP